MEDPPPSRLMALMTPFFFRKSATSQRFILSTETTRQDKVNRGSLPQLHRDDLTLLRSFSESFNRWMVVGV